MTWLIWALVSAALLLTTMACSGAEDAAIASPPPPTSSPIKAVVGATGVPRPAVEPWRLPLGDGKISSSPQRHSVFACQTRFMGGGAFRDGPWINPDGTWDSTAKAVVDGEVTWTSRFAVRDGAGRRIIETADLPDHPTGVYPIGPQDDAYLYDRNPNSISSQDLRFDLPLEPVAASQPSCLPMGPIGVLLTGAVLFNALDAQGKDAVAHEIQDRCNGHPERTGSYHYHNLTPCLSLSASGHSDLAGYALDGHGIYGPKGVDGLVLTNADLDACHGHAHEVDWNGRRMTTYHYHATLEYPYTLGCFHGTPLVRTGTP